MTAIDETRALPGLGGAIHAVIPIVIPVVVDTVTGEQSHTVTVDVSQLVDFERLAQAILNDVHLAHCFNVLARNRHSVELRVMCAKSLREDQLVRSALTLTLGPSQAEDLGEDLVAASAQPLLKVVNDAGEVQVP